jgi:hypothetical protein
MQHHASTVSSWSARSTRSARRDIPSAVTCRDPSAGGASGWRRRLPLPLHRRRHRWLIYGKTSAAVAGWLAWKIPPPTPPPYCDYYCQWMEEKLPHLLSVDEKGLYGRAKSQSSSKNRQSWPKPTRYDGLLKHEQDPEMMNENSNRMGRVREIGTRIDNVQCTRSKRHPMSKGKIRNSQRASN